MKRGWKIAVVALGVIIFIPVFFISSVQAGIFGRACDAIRLWIK